MTIRQEEELVLCDVCGYYVDGDDPAYACTCQCRDAELLLAKLDKEDLGGVTTRVADQFVREQEEARGAQRPRVADQYKSLPTGLTSLANDLDCEVTYAKDSLLNELDALIRDLKLARQSAADGIQIGNISGLVVGASGAKVDSANARLITATMTNKLVRNVYLSTLST